MISANIGGMIVKLQQNGVMTAEEQKDMLAKVRQWHEYHEEAEEQWLALVRKRRGPLHKLFTLEAATGGPLEKFAMAETLIDERYSCDEMKSYLSGEDWEGYGWKPGPIASFLFDLEDEIAELEPDTPEAATAFYRVFQREEVDGFVRDWDDDKVERAKTMALADLPRPR